MLPLMLGLIVASTVSGQIVNRTGVFKPILLTGVLILLAGLFLLFLTRAGTPVWDISWRVFIIGVGLGPTQGLFNVAIQNTVKPGDIGVATASSQFFRQIGSTMGVAIFGSLLAQNLTSAGRRLSGRLSFNLADIERMAAQNALKPGASVDHSVQAILSLAMHGLFAFALAVLVLAFALTAAIPAAKLAGRGPLSPKGQEP